MLGTIEGKRRRGRQRTRRLDGNMDLLDISLSKLQEIVKGKEAWCAVVLVLPRVRQDLVNEQQQQES